MKKKESNYFQKRFVKQEKIVHEMSLQKQKALKEIYKEARKELETDLALFIQQYSRDNKLTAADLKKMLNTKERAEFRYTVEGYVKEIDKLGADSKAGKELKKELDILAGKTRVSRREELINAIDMELSKASGKVEKLTGKHLGEVVEFAYKDTIKLLGNNTLAKLDPKAVSNIVSQKWSGKNYSSRIWINRKELAKKVMKNVTTGFIQGHDFKKMSQRLAKDMDVGFYQARRLIETETTGALENAKAQAFEDMGIKKYKFIATIDDRTSKICQDLNGKIFDMKDRQIGVNCPFCHPFCRSVTVPVVDKTSLKEKQEEFQKKVEEIKRKEREERLRRERLARAAAVNNQSKHEIIAKTEFSKEVKEVLEKEFGKLNTSEVILNKERLEHVRKGHSEILDALTKKFNNIMGEPDYILKDEGHENTILIIKKLEKGNLDTVVKLSLGGEYKNSVITSYKVRNGYLKKLLEKYKILLKK